MPAHHRARTVLHLAVPALLACAAGLAWAQPRPVSPPASAAVAPAPAASAGGLSDAVARCEARPDGLEKRACRRALAHQSPGRT